MSFVLIDRLLELTPGRHARAEKTFQPDEPWTADHFPGMPVVPGVLLVEAMGQTAGWLLAATLGFTRWPLLVMADRVKFRRLVRPGERLLLSAELRADRGDDFEMQVEAQIDGVRVADARLMFHAFTFTLPDGDAAAFAAWGRDTFDRLGGHLLQTESSS